MAAILKPQLLCRISLSQPKKEKKKKSLVESACSGLFFTINFVEKWLTTFITGFLIDNRDISVHVVLLVRSTACRQTWYAYVITLNHPLRYAV